MAMVFALSVLFSFPASTEAPIRQLLKREALTSSHATGREDRAHRARRTDWCG